MKVRVPFIPFDAGFYERYYRDPRTRVASRSDALRLGRFVCAYADYVGFTVRRVLDAGCGLGHLRAAVKERFPRARYVGLETSARSEEHTSELQSQSNLVCRLLLEKK